MKKILFFTLIAGLTSCTGRNSKMTTGLEGKPIPSFNLLLMDSTTRFNTGNIPTGKPIVVLLFSPHCPYCKAQTELIIKEIKSLNDIRFYLLSFYPFDQVKDYYDHYHLKEYQNLKVGCDHDNNFGNYYKAPGVPYIAIYNKNKQLMKVFLGKVGINLIKDIAFK